jgi:hypothetical protein
MKNIIFIIVTIFISGCSATGAIWPWKESKPCSTGTSCNSFDATNAYVAAADYCRQVQNYYERGGQRANVSKLALGAVGVLAGSVAAPIATGTTAAALSGLSGATNAFQASLDETYAGSVSIKRRDAVASASKQGSTDYNQATDDTKRVIIAINMALNCSTSSATADKAAMRALMEN